jgi:hypothetical protein
MPPARPSTTWSPTTRAPAPGGQVDVPERAGAEVEHREFRHGEDAYQHPRRGGERNAGGRGRTRVLWSAFAAHHREQIRPVREGATTLSHLRAWGCGLRSLQEPWIDTTTPIREAMFHGLPDPSSAAGIGGCGGGTPWLR